MMFRNLCCRNADDVWAFLVRTFQSTNAVDVHDSRAGRVYDLGNVCISIDDPRQRWMISRQPAMNPAFAIAEVVWIMNARNDAKFLNFFNSQLSRFAGDSSTYDGAYGYRLRSNLGIDQLDRAHSALQSNSQTRQVVLQIWDGKRDLPMEDGAPASPDIPCNIVSLLKVRNEYLDWTQVLRSNDVYRGLPHNIIQFTTLQEVLAGWLGLRCGQFHLVTDSLHLYESDAQHIAIAKDLPQITNSDDLSVDRIESESSFKLLSSLVDSIIEPDCSAERVQRCVQTADLSPAFRNMLCVLSAEVLRRRRDLNGAHETMLYCSNPLLCLAWNRWIARIVKVQPNAVHRPVSMTLLANSQGDRECFGAARNSRPKYPYKT